MNDLDDFLLKDMCNIFVFVYKENVKVSVCQIDFWELVSYDAMTLNFL